MAVDLSAASYYYDGSNPNSTDPAGWYAVLLLDLEGYSPWKRSYLAAEHWSYTSNQHSWAIWLDQTANWPHSPFMWLRSHTGYVSWRNPIQYLSDDGPTGLQCLRTRVVYSSVNQAYLGLIDISNTYGEWYTMGYSAFAPGTIYQ